MHITDGVLSLPVLGASVVGAIAVLAYSVKGTKAEEIPRISLLTGTFFVLSLIHIPLGPTSVHPLMAGLLGILLGRRAPVAIFLGLSLQFLLFQFGGLTTLGVNTLLVSLPALAAYRFYYIFNNLSIFIRGSLSGGLGVLFVAVLLVITLSMSSDYFVGGLFSAVNLIAASYIPLIFIELLFTGFAVQLLHRARPGYLMASAPDPDS